MIFAEEVAVSPFKCRPWADAVSSYEVIGTVRAPLYSRWLLETGPAYIPAEANFGLLTKP